MDPDPAGPGLLAAGPPARLAVRVTGIVQGVGFRPFVHTLASRLGLAGFVGNDPAGVFCEVEGPAGALDAFLEALRADAPPLAVVERVTTTAVPARGERNFAIAPSAAGPDRRALVSADTATCPDCLREMADPSDRRYRYAFTNCTNCGPRFTIVRDVPYDRPNTTMAPFTMCADCAREYRDPADRRFHAQPVCCPACGPTLRLLDRDREPAAGDPVAGAARLLQAGGVVAVKGLGGYHLAALASDAVAVASLRARKHREDKPFAVMAADLDAARRLGRLGGEDIRILCGPRRPVVLAARRSGAPLAPAVAPANRWLGIMLPYTPLHHLLAEAVGEPFVLTSGNVSDEPIAYRDDDAFERLAAIADAFLVHDRAIHIRVDDSVVRTFRGRELPLRRSRGYAPQPLALAVPAGRPVLGCGAELKSTFCLARGHHAFVSHHIGDLENYETLRSFRHGVDHFRRLFAIEPELVVHDLHPEYLSTKFALSLDGVDLLGVQHHHAHIAACLAEHGHPGPVIGVAFDGLGLGADGTLWGGELLLADLSGYRRVGHLSLVAMPGGTAAIREPWRMAAAWLDAAYGGQPPGLSLADRNRARWEQVLTVSRSGTNSPLTSSAGRLFDAVAAILGVRDTVNYEGQAAVELEQMADPDATDGYPVTVTAGDPVHIEAAHLIRAVVDDLRSGTAPERIAARFHNGLAAATVAAVEVVAARSGMDTVALSGGVFQNHVLLTRVHDGLLSRRLRVLVHSQVPPNDGGISLGQAAIGSARPAP